MKTKDELLTANLTELAKLIKEKDVSPVEVTTHLLDRIDEIDPKINSYITVDHEAALKQAQKAEKEIMNGQYHGPLHGVAIGLKDLIYTKNIKTTMGSEIYQDFVPEVNAFVVEKLAHAGAIMIGKQNTHQFAYGPTGDRSFSGPVHNPYDLQKMTGGSSSGSAAAVSACLCYGSLGTDTGGSVRIPASFCGVVGMKPTFGRVSRRGVYPLSYNLDHVGPLTRTIIDNAILLNAITEYDEKDLFATDYKTEDFLAQLEKGVQGLKIGIPNTFFFDHMDREVEANIRQTIKILENMGAKIQEIEISKMEEVGDAQRIIISSDAYALHKERLKEYPDKWDDEVKERLLTALDVMGYDYSNAIQIRQQAKREFNRVLDNIDVILTPTVPILPPKINARHVEIDKYNEEHIRWSILKLTQPTNLTGFPSLSVPSGFSEAGMPIGVQFIGRYFSEDLLYRVGYTLEQELQIQTYKYDIE